MFFDVHMSYLCYLSNDAQMNLTQTLSITSGWNMMHVDAVNYGIVVVIIVEIYYLFDRLL